MSETEDRLAKYWELKILKHGLGLGLGRKQGPFFYDKRGFENYNAKFTAAGGVYDGRERVSREFVCRHISAALVGESASSEQTHGQFKDRLDAFSHADKADGFLNRLGYPELEHRSESVGPVVHCNDAKFGALVGALAASVQEGRAATYYVHVRCEATGHSMALHIYKEDGLIGVAVHDPNMTPNALHGKYDESTILGLRFKDFIGAAYPTLSETFSIGPVPSSFASEHAGMWVGEDVGQQVDSIWGALASGSAEHIKKIVASLVKTKMDPECLVTLLNDTNKRNGYPGLHMALQNNHGDAISALGDLLGLTPSHERLSLLAAKSRSGTPGLSIALQRGAAEAIRAFVQLMTLVTDKEQCELALATRADGAPGLYMALQLGNARSIAAFEAVLTKIPETQRASVLAAKSATGNPGLFMALSAGHFAAVEAFGRLLTLVPPWERAELMAAKNSAGVPGLFMALENGKTNAVRQFGRLLALVPLDQRGPLLCAKKGDGASGWRAALAQSHRDTLMALAAIVQNEAKELSTGARRDLLKAIRESHGGRSMSTLLIWRNRPEYNTLKKKDAEFYKAFKAMKWSLRSANP